MKKRKKRSLPAYANGGLVPKQAEIKASDNNAEETSFWEDVGHMIRQDVTPATQVEISRKYSEPVKKAVQYATSLGQYIPGPAGIASEIANSLMGFQESQEAYDRGEKDLANVRAFGAIPIPNVKLPAKPGRSGRLLQFANAAQTAYDFIPDAFFTQKPDTSRSPSYFKKAGGGDVGSGNMVPVEVEGGEIAQMPNGETMEFSGPNHESGGVPAVLPENTEIYSKRIKINGESMVERKQARQRKTDRLAKLFEKDPTNPLAQNTIKRTATALIQEEQMDRQIMETAGPVMSAQVERQSDKKSKTRKQQKSSTPRPLSDTADASQPQYALGGSLTTGFVDKAGAALSGVGSGPSTGMGNLSWGALGTGLVQIATQLAHGEYEEVDNPLLAQTAHLRPYMHGGEIENSNMGFGFNMDMNLYAGGGKAKHWIQKAVNPKHRGFCTPMTKSTCTPRRKAFAKTMKKHHGFHAGGGEVKYVADLPEVVFKVPKKEKPIVSQPVVIGMPVGVPDYAPITPASMYQIEQELAETEISAADLEQAREGKPKKSRLEKFWNKLTPEKKRDFEAFVQNLDASTISSRGVGLEGQRYGLGGIYAFGGQVENNLQVGDEMDISPAEIARLRKLGYEFE